MARQPSEGATVPIYQHIRHPHIASRLAAGPVKVSDLLPRGNAVNRFNTKVAIWVTNVVGSMWCAYAFALFDLISLPDAIRTGTAAIVAWVAQTFLQLVLLSVIMVGQNVQATEIAAQIGIRPVPVIDSDDQDGGTGPDR
jgi:hypothetical protein